MPSIWQTILAGMRPAPVRPVVVPGVAVATPPVLPIKPGETVAGRIVGIAPAPVVPGVAVATPPVRPIVCPPCPPCEKALDGLGNYVRDTGMVIARPATDAPAWYRAQQQVYGPSLPGGMGTSDTGTGIGLMGLGVVAGIIWLLIAAGSAGKK